MTEKPEPPMTILNRLRSAESGSRELDAMIAVSLQIMPSNAFQPCASSDAGTFGTGAHTFWTAPRYTTNIDAALALVERMLPDALYDLHKHYGGRWAASVLRENHKRPYFEASSAPLAILTALFTALEAKDIPPGSRRKPCERWQTD